MSNDANPAGLAAYLLTPVQPKRQGIVAFAMGVLCEMVWENGALGKIRTPDP